MAWVTAPTFTAGQTAGVSSGLNQISADLNIIGGVRPSFTPTWTQSSTNPTLGNGTLTGDYRQVDKEIDFTIQLTIGSSTVLGTGTFLFALPAACRRAGYVFLGGAVDVSASTQATPIAGEVVAGTLNQIAMRVWPTTAGGGFQVLNQSQPIATPATGDTYTISGRYEAA